MASRHPIFRGVLSSQRYDSFDFIRSILKGKEDEMVDQHKNDTEQKIKDKSWRTISTDKYIIAGIITALIFGLGLTLGLILEDARYGLVQQVNQDQEVRYQSLQLQYLFLQLHEYYPDQPRFCLRAHNLQQLLCLKCDPCLLK